MSAKTQFLKAMRSTVRTFESCPGAVVGCRDHDKHAEQIQVMLGRIAEIEALDDSLIAQHPYLGRVMTKDGRIDPVKAIVLHVVSDDGPEPVTTRTKGWIHTHRMADFDLPELEIRDVPLFMAEAAMDILNLVASYMINEVGVIKLGETMQLGPMCVFRFEKLPPLDDATHSEERWTLTDAPMTHWCEAAGRDDVEPESADGHPPNS